jgi:hypothetical protein
VQASTGVRGDEAERLSHNHLGTEHLFLVLLREEKCFAAEILHELELRISTVRDQLAHADDTPPRDAANAASALSSVAITSTPAGTDIQVDDVFLGHTPAELPPRYRRADGHHREERLSAVAMKVDGSVWWKTDAIG